MTDNPLIAAIGPDTELIALCTAAVRNHERTVRLSKAADDLLLDSAEYRQAEAEIFAHVAEWRELCERITITPASTPAGLRRKAEIIGLVFAVGDPLLESVVQDVQTVADSPLLPGTTPVVYSFVYSMGMRDERWRTCQTRH